MKRFLSASIFIILLSGLLYSCGVARRIPADQYLLTKVKVRVVESQRDSTLNLSHKELIAKSELLKYAQQQPAKRFLGTNIPLWIYSTANPSKTNWWNNTKRRMGSAPVYLDSALVENSARIMNIHMNSRGYIQSQMSYNISAAKRKAHITYLANPKKPFTIGSINYEFQDAALRHIILEDTISCLMSVGDLYDTGVRNKESARMVEYLKDRGYFNFTAANIGYNLSSDTTGGNRTIDVRIILKQRLFGYNQNGTPMLENNWVYRIKDIYVHSDATLVGARDTTYYRGLNIVDKPRPRVRQSVLRRSVSFNENHLYSTSLEKRTYNNIMILGSYRNARIVFSPAPADTTLKDNLVTYAFGQEGAQDSLAQIQEAYLNCNIYCTPSKRHSYTLEIEGSTTSDYYGLLGKLGYQNRNIFRGAELLDIGLSGGYEFMKSKGKRSSYELGITTSLSFPQFVVPLRVNPYNRVLNPKTRIELSMSVQRRPYYHRTVSRVMWAYSWGNGRNSSFVLRPIDVSLTKMGYVDKVNFLDSITNLSLRNSYISQIAPGLSASYTFNDQLKSLRSSSTALRINFETNGNLLKGIYSALGVAEKVVDDESQRRSHKLFGVPFAQYLRFDVSLSRKFTIGERGSIVYRLYGGWGYAYGNSASIPFDRYFYSGGSNSMRGWTPRMLGPGNSAIPENQIYPSQLGNLKLESNIEGRFPIVGFVDGALFFDLGNIWFTGQKDADAQGMFHLNSFYKQLGFNTGVGVRLNFDLFVLRLDWGIQLHNPNEPQGRRWNNGLNLRHSALNFGVGYPF